MKRNAALEAAVIADPLDAGPRMVYGDWFQSVGDPFGEWTALSTAIEADVANIEMRATGVGYLDDHQKAILGDGSGVLRGGWIGWRGGFIDEIRLQEPLTNPVRRMRALLALPCARFVRYIAIGQVSNVEAIVDEIVAAALPLLEGLLIGDSQGPWRSKLELDAIGKLQALRKLTLRGARVGVKMPALRELSIAPDLSVDAPTIKWLVGGGCPNLEELAIDCGHEHGAAAILALLDAHPELQRLRLHDLRGADHVAAAFHGALERLELLEISHSDLTTAGITSLARTKLRAICVGEPENDFFARDSESWVVHALDDGGRDAVRMIPGAGRTLYQTSTDEPDERAIELLTVALTLPDAAIGTHPYANAAGSTARLHRFAESELISREALLRSPLEPNMFWFLLDAMRRGGRLAEAVRLVPRAVETLTKTNPDPNPHRGKTRECCLVDILMTLAQAHHHVQVIALATEHDALATPPVHAIVAMSQLALHKRQHAKQSLAKANGAGAVLNHANAAMLAADGQHVKAMNQLAKARAADYPEWHWIALDPNLKALRDLPKFKALQSS